MDLQQKIVISDKYKFVYFETNKVATRSMLNYFVRKPRMNYGAKRFIRKKVNSEYFRFGFVRNPWERVVSCYSHKIVDTVLGKPLILDPRLSHNMPFEEFVDYLLENKKEKEADIHIRSQWTFVNECDFVGRFETLNEDLAYVLAVLRLPLYPLRKKNVSAREKPWEDYYTKETFEKVRDRYFMDIKRFDYGA